MRINLSKGIIALGLVLGFNASAQVTTTLGGESATYLKKGANHLNFNLKSKTIIYKRMFFC